MNDLWLQWLGAPGTTPPPLDGFLSHHRAERRVAEVLGRWCATAALAVTVERGAKAAPGGIALLDQLRETDPRLIEA
ncbi:MAG: hypothetical protein KC621_16180, partial [Myxococcales bacterium]|nr:hypothetical protein [Myxococcales bacterium]